MKTEQYIDQFMDKIYGPDEERDAFDMIDDAAAFLMYIEQNPLTAMAHAKKVAMLSWLILENLHRFAYAEIDALQERISVLEKEMGNG